MTSFDDTVAEEPSWWPGVSSPETPRPVQSGMGTGSDSHQHPGVAQLAEVTSTRAGVLATRRSERHRRSSPSIADVSRRGARRSARLTGEGIDERHRCHTGDVVVVTVWSGPPV